MELEKGEETPRNEHNEENREGNNNHIRKWRENIYR